MLGICFIYFLLFLMISMILFFFSFYLIMNEVSIFLEFHLFSLNSNDVMMTLLFDWMSVLFMSFVLFISSMVIFYSDDYMKGDMNLDRFIILVCLFVVSMMMLIISPNLISILLGWDGLGLVSYCLVIYYQNVKSSSAGMLTALTNRIGDVTILMAIAWMLNYGSWDFLFYLDYFKNDFYMQIISFLVVLAAMTKSAQIPFSSWLPAAMAAPTPVSSLVHSSTLVTAGVYLVIRFYNCLSSNLLFFLMLISCLTMFMSGLGANYEYDLKKIIALSTLSQLGLMMASISLGEPILAFFHLLTHALFKALLFMCAGTMIHSMGNMQDIRYYGGFSVLMPLTCCLFIISNLALCGMPFLAGFYSKDLILEVFSLSYFNILIYILFFISTGLTVSYTSRLVYYVLFNEANFLGLYSFVESPQPLIKGMVGLIFFVIMGGSLLSWIVFPLPYFICLPTYMKYATLIVIVLGGYLGYEVSKLDLSYLINKKLNLVYFFSNMWNMPYISCNGFNFFFLDLGGFSGKLLDQGWLEFFGSQHIYNTYKMNSTFFSQISKNGFKIFLFLFSSWIFILILMF
uniref:NADH dehydrogenase subunit 5 n=1 Tax=Sambus kanssuensis TaxID=3045898 RepID=UPI00257DDF74|nr:NADH dehydrogenase subunit 5 [Sambus kanssuensis]WHE42541.1 NADH dehydrogenase subunit 5 [Sambus kanssuensis]